VIQPPLQMDTSSRPYKSTHLAAPTVLFVGVAAVLEPEYVTVEAAPMLASPKKSPVATNYFSRSESLNWTRCYKLFVHLFGKVKKMCKFISTYSFLAYL